MNQYITAETIQMLREKKNMTQRQLAEVLCVSDKTVSKWENGRGLPDITILEPLAAALGVSVAELISGACISNANRSGDMMRGKFYVCPICQNVIFSTGEGAFSCCGVSLPPLEAEECGSVVYTEKEDRTADIGAWQEHEIHVERVENEWYVCVQHSMTKIHYISFIAYLTKDRVQIVHLYPEQNAETRFLISGRGKIFAYCNRHGLYEINPKPRV